MLCLLAFTESPDLNETTLYLERASKVIYSKSTGEIRATGDVIVRIRNITISTDSLFIDMKNRTIKASGNILVNIKGTYFIAENMNYNIEKDTGKMETAYTYISGIYLYARELNKMGDHYIMKNALFTTCNANPPHYAMSASLLSMKANQYIWGRFVALRIGVIPLLFIPYFRYEFRVKKAFEVSTGQSTYLGYYAAIFYRTGGMLPRWGVLASSMRGLAPLLEFNYRAKKFSASARAFAIYEGIPWGHRGRETPFRGFAGARIVFPAIKSLKIVGSSFFISDRYLPIDYAPSVLGAYPRHSLYIYWNKKLMNLTVRSRLGIRRTDGWSGEAQIPVSQDIPFFEVSLRKPSYGLRFDGARTFRHNEIYNGRPVSMWYNYLKGKLFWNSVYRNPVLSLNFHLSMNSENFLLTHEPHSSQKRPEESLYPFVYIFTKESVRFRSTSKFVEKLHFELESQQKKLLYGNAQNFPLTYHRHGDQVNLSGKLTTELSESLGDSERIFVEWNPYFELKETFPWKMYPVLRATLNLSKLPWKFRFYAMGTYSFFWKDFSYYTLKLSQKGTLEIYYLESKLYSYFPEPALQSKNNYIGGTLTIRIKPHTTVRISTRYALHSRTLDRLSIVAERDLHCWEGIFSYDYFSKRFSFSLILKGMPSFKLGQTLPVGK